MRLYLRRLFTAPFQLVLVVSFSLVAALAIAIGTWTISRTIADYMTDEMNARISRDMQLSQAFYEIMLSEIQAISDRLSQDPLVVQNFEALQQGDPTALDYLEKQMELNLADNTTGGNHTILVLDPSGNAIAGRLLKTGDGQEKIIPSDRAAGLQWDELEIVRQAIDQGQAIQTAAVIPSELLDSVGLAEQTLISIIETPKAASELFDPREETAGLALAGISPVRSAAGEILGAVLVFHLFNNDFTLVDRIRQVAGIDTATIFFGDLRVSTNVMTETGQRAIGTRVSDEVSRVVLSQGDIFTGPAFVVNENYITRYDPILDQNGKILGILYIGARQSTFNRLISLVNNRIFLVGGGTFVLVFLLALPVSVVITRPLNQLHDLVAASQKVTEGDLSVRVPVRPGGEVGMLASSFNIMLDTLQSTHEQLIQSEKLASLGQLAAGVAHELNNPLGTIMLYADILLKETAAENLQEPGSTRREDLEMIISETQRCKTIVSSLLEFARQNQVSAGEVDLNEIIVQLLELESMRRADAAANAGTVIEMRHDLDALLPRIQADENQLIQVLSNLIDNAVDAMPGGGVLTITTRSKPAGMVTLEVSDTGMGISDRNKSKLFTPFFTTKPLGKGTGLGLAITYGIIKMHRGQITVSSQVGKGTRFTILLPVKLQLVDTVRREGVGA